MGKTPKFNGWIVVGALWFVYLLNMGISVICRNGDQYLYAERNTDGPGNLRDGIHAV